VTQCSANAAATLGLVSRFLVYGFPFAKDATPLHVTPRESELEGVFRSLTEMKDGVRMRVFVNPDYVVTIRDPEIAAEEGCILSLAGGATPLHVLQKGHMVAEWFN
jgi:hypothetical protein